MGYLLSSGLLAELDKRGPDFMPFYRAMLRDTGRDTVDGIVRRHCGADAANPAFWEGAARRRESVRGAQQQMTDMKHSQFQNFNRFQRRKTMKHTALHLAVFGVLAGAALAAQAADVQIYGRVDAGFLYEHKKGEDTFTQKAGGRAHNRIGFNVVEDLGNGVKVKAYLENGFYIDIG